MVDYDVDRTVSMLNMRHETLIFQRSFGIFSGVRGGCSSTAEHRIVVPRVAGSKPVSHPTKGAHADALHQEAGRLTTFPLLGA